MNIAALQTEQLRWFSNPPKLPEPLKKTHLEALFDSADTTASGTAAAAAAAAASGHSVHGTTPLLCNSVESIDRLPIETGQCARATTPSSAIKISATLSLLPTQTSRTVGGAHAAPLPIACAPSRFYMRAGFEQSPSSLLRDLHRLVCARERNERETLPTHRLSAVWTASTYFEHDQVIRCIKLTKVDNETYCLQVTLNPSRSLQQISVLQRILATCLSRAHGVREYGDPNASRKQRKDARRVFANDVGRLTVYSFAWLCSVVATMCFVGPASTMESVLIDNLRAMYTQHADRGTNDRRGECTAGVFCTMFLLSIAVRRQQPMLQIVSFLHKQRQLVDFIAFCEATMPNVVQKSSVDRVVVHDSEIQKHRRLEILHSTALNLLQRLCSHVGIDYETVRDKQPRAVTASVVAENVTDLHDPVAYQVLEAIYDAKTVTDNSDDCDDAVGCTRDIDDANVSTANASIAPRRRDSLPKTVPQLAHQRAVLRTIAFCNVAVQWIARVGQLLSQPRARIFLVLGTTICRLTWEPDNADGTRPHRRHVLTRFVESATTSVADSGSTAGASETVTIDDSVVATTITETTQTLSLEDLRQWLFYCSVLQLGSGETQRASFLETDQEATTIVDTNDADSDAFLLFQVEPECVRFGAPPRLTFGESGNVDLLSYLLLESEFYVAQDATERGRLHDKRARMCIGDSLLHTQIEHRAPFEGFCKLSVASLSLARREFDISHVQNISLDIFR